MGKWRLSKKTYNYLQIYISRFTFLINDGMGIKRCPHTSELWLIIQNPGLAAWHLQSVNPSLWVWSRCCPNIPPYLYPRHPRNSSPRRIPSHPPVPPFLRSLSCQFPLLLIVKWFSLCCCLSQPLGKRGTEVDSPAFALTCLSHLTPHRGMLCLSALVIISIWHCVCFIVFTSAPTLLPIQWCLLFKATREGKIYFFCQMLKRKKG